METSVNKDPSMAAMVASDKKAAAAPKRAKRIPMSVPVRRMEVPPLDGYFLYWFAEANVPRALQAGYEYVGKNEVSLNQMGVGADRITSGNTDLGSNVSMIGSVDGRAGGAERAYLMKLRNEWREEDELQMREIAARPMQAIFQGEQIVGKEGKVNEKGELEYVKTALLQRPTRKAKIVSGGRT